MHVKEKKIVSFLPSATEILYEIGAGPQIVGVTHECKYPEDAKLKPRVINSVFDASVMSSKDIDQKIVELYSNGKDIYIVNDQILRDLKPDLIVAQGICEVCSPFKSEIKRAISILGYSPETIILDPHSINDILNNINEIAKQVDKIERGRKLVDSLNKKIISIREVISKKNVKKSSGILCLEWIEPFFTAGHWVPEMIEIAGGVNYLSKTGEKSRRSTIEEIKKFDPGKIILMPCGFDIERTIKEYERTIKNNSSWNSLRAIKEKELYIVDAGSYFSKPGPRTFIGIEVLAKIINPNEFNHIRVPSKSFIKLD